jgi:DNA-binding beta-propeller fold protein YncE
MKKKSFPWLLMIAIYVQAIAALTFFSGHISRAETNSGKPPIKRYLYVATPGIRNYLEYGGHGILVFDMDNNYRFVKRIPTAGLNEEGKPSNVKGIAVSLATNCIYITTLQSLQCIDLITEKLLWEKKYEGGCDRLAISPDGKTIYLPSLEKEHWHVINAKTGDVLKKVITNSGAHNTIYGQDGAQVYLAGLRSAYLMVAETKNHTISKEVGPFMASIRPFTINGKQTLCFVNVNGLLGFEVGDLTTGKKLHQVKVEGFEIGPVKRHGCPSHGIALTPDEKELWLADAANQRLHIFDATLMPPKQKESISLRDQPGWITFSMDGKYVYPSTGEIIEAKTRKIITSLQDENGNPVQSEKIVEIHFNGKKAVAAGDQFGFGRITQ